MARIGGNADSAPGNWERRPGNARAANRGSGQTVRGTEEIT